MVALVTGANGFLGSRVTAYLRSQGIKVRGFVRRPESLDLDEVALGDVTDAAAVQEAVAGTDFIVHCAAVSGPDAATSLKVNGEGTANLVEAALTAGCKRFVLISTQSVYDKSTSGKVYEDAPLCTDGNPYEVGKIAAERAVRAGEARGLQAVILRAPMILGAHPTSTWGFKIAKMLLDGRFPLVGDGSNTATYIHVDNLAHVVFLALTSPRAVGQAYNTVDGYTTWRAYTDQIREWLGVGELPSIDPAKAPAAFGWQGYPAGDKLVEELGYTPRYTYADAMNETRAFLEASGLVKR